MFFPDRREDLEPSLHFLVVPHSPQWNLDVSGAVAAALQPLGNKYMDGRTEGQDAEDEEREGYRELIFGMA